MKSAAIFCRSGFRPDASGIGLELHDLRLPAFLFSSFILLLCLLLPGCAKRETAVEAGIRTKTLIVGNGAEPASLDPHVLVTGTDYNIAKVLYEGLTSKDEATFKPVPAVAERWEVSPDGLVYTFHLRHAARWSNGDPVTARDFAYSFQRILTPKLASAYAYMLWPIKNARAFNAGQLADFAQVGVTVIDDAILRLTLDRPTPYLPGLAANTPWLPVHRPTIEKFGKLEDPNTAWTRPGNLVGNGAFVLTEWRPNDRIVVAKNPHYWDAARNRLERVIFLPIESSSVEERNFRAGQMHITFAVPTSKIPNYRLQVPGRLRIDPMLNTDYVDFNVTKPPLDNAKLRRALALAIDRDAIARSVYQGAAQPALTYTASDHSGYVPPVRPAHDSAAARALLAEAGFPGGRGLPSFPMQVAKNDIYPKVAEVIQAMWQRELGVRITIEPLDEKTLFQNQQALAHTICLTGWNADYADPTTFLDTLLTGNGNNWTGWGSKEYDGLLEQAANTVDPQTRFQILQRAEALLLEAAPIVPLVHNAHAYLIHPAVKNWIPGTGDRRYQYRWLEP
jgi:oligopeptide transport system substrate-binding protein